MTVDADGEASAASADLRPSVLKGADIELPSALPAFLAACGRLASEAAAREDLVTARDLMEKAARVAAMDPRKQSTSQRERGGRAPQ